MKILNKMVGWVIDLIVACHRVLLLFLVLGGACFGIAKGCEAETRTCNANTPINARAWVQRTYQNRPVHMEKRDRECYDLIPESGAPLTICCSCDRNQSCYISH